MLAEHVKEEFRASGGQRGKALVSSMISGRGRRAGQDSFHCRSSHPHPRWQALPQGLALGSLAGAAIRLFVYGQLYHGQVAFDLGVVNVDVQFVEICQAAFQVIQPPLPPDTDRGMYGLKMV